MHSRALYSIQESRALLGGISRNTIYDLMRTGQLASVLIGCRRFISADAIADLIARSTTTDSPSRMACRARRLPDQQPLPLPLLGPTRARTKRGQT
jgi:Helix-turn-helix domain